MVAGTSPQSVFSFRSFQHLHFEVECWSPATLHVLRHSHYTYAMNRTTTPKCKLLWKTKLPPLSGVCGSHPPPVSCAKAPWPTPNSPLRAGRSPTLQEEPGLAGGECKTSLAQAGAPARARRGGRAGAGGGRRGSVTRGSGQVEFFLRRRQFVLQSPLPPVQVAPPQPVRLPAHKHSGGEGQQHGQLQLPLRHVRHSGYQDCRMACGGQRSETARRVHWGGKGGVACQRDLRRGGRVRRRSAFMEEVEKVILRERGLHLTFWVVTPVITLCM